MLLLPPEIHQLFASFADDSCLPAYHLAFSDCAAVAPFIVRGALERFSNCVPSSAKHGNMHEVTCGHSAPGERLFIHGRKLEDWKYNTVRFRACGACMTYGFYRFVRNHQRLPRLRCDGASIRNWAAYFAENSEEQTRWLLAPERLIFDRLLPHHYNCDYYENHPELVAALCAQGISCKNDA